MTNHIVRPHADFERWARGIENFPDAVRAVEGAYGQGWADCEKSHPAAASAESIRAEVIEECARVAHAGSVAAFEQMAGGSTDAANPSHTHAEAMEAVGKALAECESMIRALALARSTGGM